MTDTESDGSTLLGVLVLGALVTGAVMLLPLLVAVRVVQVVREARASAFDRGGL